MFRPLNHRVEFGKTSNWKIDPKYVSGNTIFSSSKETDAELTEATNPSVFFSSQVKQTDSLFQGPPDAVP